MSLVSRMSTFAFGNSLASCFCNGCSAGAAAAAVGAADGAGVGAGVAFGAAKAVDDKATRAAAVTISSLRFTTRFIGWLLPRHAELKQQFPRARCSQSKAIHAGIDQSQSLRLVYGWRGAWGARKTLNGRGSVCRWTSAVGKVKVLYGNGA